ncbi:MAG: hypothetical protein HY685_06320 [Chloroflexi bacterium]|nr:hypothetical protein [Chloroflexota bacterium]
MSLTQALLNDYKSYISDLRLVPATGGRFEVTIAGDLVHSKAASGKLPVEAEIKRAFKERLDALQAPSR